MSTSTVSRLGRFMEAEIEEQPAIFARILSSGVGPITDVAERIRSRAPRFILLVARGTSDNAALYAKYLIETKLHIPAALTSPSVVTVYGSQLRLDGCLVIAISQSGGSPDVTIFTEAARQGGATTLAITNTHDSPLAGAAEFHVSLMAGAERAVAATKTYTSELLTAYLLIAGLAGEPPVGLDQLPDLARATLALGPEIEETAQRYRFADHLLVTSRGYNLSTAQEGALKLIETTGVPAHAFSSADLMHGPVAMIDRGFPVIAILPPGKGGATMEPVLAALRDRSADRLIITSGERSVGERQWTVPEISEELSPLLMILPLQLLALQLSRTRGIDADAPGGLTKITETI